ncbi:MAG: ATP synthase F1 subunit epsilon [Solirubrobacterales bacterium]
MARTPFPVEVLTPEGRVFEGEVEMLSTRTEVGEIGVLANHAPVLAMLAPAELRLHASETEVTRFAQGEGYLQVHDNHALVLVEDCVEPAAVDRDQYREQLTKAEQTIKEIGHHSSEEQQEARFARALRDRRRAETFLRVAGEN